MSAYKLTIKTDTSGSTVELPLVSDSIVDTNQTNKFVTESDKTNWNGKATGSLTTTTGSEAVTINSNSLTLVTRDTAQTISGAKTFSSNVIMDTPQINAIKAYTSSSSSTYGVGTSGQVLKSNGTRAYWGSDSSDNTSSSIGANYKWKNQMAGYQVFITDKDNKLVPMVTGTSGTASTGTSKTMNTQSFNPFGLVGATTSSSYKAADALCSSSTFTAYSSVNLSYSFNCGSTLTDKTPVYIVMQIDTNGNGSLTSPYYSQTLPSTIDNKYYMYLGQAISTTNINLQEFHPIYYYDGSKVSLYTKDDLIKSVQISATSPVQSSTSTAQTGTVSTTISLADNYGDTKNPYANKTANTVLAAPNGSAGAPTFRSLVKADLPSLTAADVGAMPNYTLNISTGAGNPRQVKFVRINYTTFDGNNAAYFKISAACSHGNGTSYTFMEDIIIGCNSSGNATCEIYKQVQNTSTYVIDSVPVYFGDVFWTVDTTNKLVDFYIIGGQYATLKFTKFTAIGNTVTDTSKIIQSSGSATLYSSGTRNWASGNGTLYARAKGTLSSGKILSGAGGTNIEASELYVGSTAYYDSISSQRGILIDSGQGETIYLGGDESSVVEIGSQGNDEVELRIYGYLANGTGSKTYSLPSSSGQLATTADILEYELGCSNTAISVSVPSGGSVSLTVSSTQVPLFLGYGIIEPEDLDYYSVHSYEASINKNSSGWKAYAYAYDGNGSIIDNVYIEIRYILISVDVV